MLDGILAALKSEDTEAQHAALSKLEALPYSSTAIVATLEQLALNADYSLRRAALAALRSAASLAVYKQNSTLNQHDREVVLGELYAWQKKGLLDETRAAILKGRYGFDILPTWRPGPAPVSLTGTASTEIPAPRPEHTKPAEPVTPAPGPAPTTRPIAKTHKATPSPEPKPIPTPAPQRTLLQAILSETSIKIFLYLGALFVISAAAFAAALVAQWRLPILIASTLLFGVAAVSIRKRLPQPSFTLFIVFSFLLPITGSVVRQSLSITGQASHVYWLFVFLFMALIWGISTWLYESGLFSITAFASLALGLYQVGRMFEAETELYGTLFGLAALIGLAGVWGLKRWKGPKFALDLFITTQAVQVGVLGVTLLVGGYRLLVPEVSVSWNFACAATWLLAFCFYAIANLLYPVFFFPWLSALALVPVPWFLMSALQLDGTGATSLFLVWGLVLAAASEITQRMESARKYSLPTLLGSIPTLAVAIFTGFIVDTLHGFGVALIIAAGYTILHIIRRREWLWSLALFNFVLAYFGFFGLPFIQRAEVFWGYRLLGLGLLLLLPDLFLKNDFKDNLPWRRPLRVYGVAFTLGNFFVLALQTHPLGNLAIIFGAYAVFFALYALRYQKPVIGYVSTLALSLSFLFMLQHLDLDLWLPVLTALSVTYYLGGFVLRKSEAHAGWRSMLVNSTMILGSSISLIALLTLKDNSGWFLAIIGALFMAEMYVSGNSLFELGVQLLFPAAVFLILRDFNSSDPHYVLLGLGLAWLSLDLAFARTFRGKRAAELIAKILGITSVLIGTLIVLFQAQAAAAAIYFAIATIFFAIYTAIQGKAAYGYIPAFYLPLAIYFALEHYHIDAWMPAITALAVAYVAVGYAVRAKAGWSSMLRYSGLTVGSLLSIGIMLALKETGGWYQAVIGALFIIEMVLSRQSLFEVGAHLLIPSGICLILRDFNLDEPAYILIGISLAWLSLDLGFAHAFKEKRPLEKLAKIAGALATLAASLLLIVSGDTTQAALGFGILTIFFVLYTLIERKAVLGYAPAVFLSLTVFFAFRHFELSNWVAVLTGLAVLYFAIGYAIRTRQDWSLMLRNSALMLGMVISIGALFASQQGDGWYILLIGLLFVAEMYLRRDGRLEVGLPIAFNIGATLLLRDFQIHEAPYFLLVYSLAWLLTDLFAHLTFARTRPFKQPIRVIGGLLVLANYLYLLDTSTQNILPATVCLGIYSLVFLAITLAYRKPGLLYAFTFTLPFFTANLFREFEMTRWIHPVIILAVGYYAVGYFLRQTKRAAGWDVAWLYSGLGLGVVVSLGAFILGGLDAAIPVAIAATLWAMEAFARRNVWLGFPANMLYLLAYFIVLFELNVNELQFFSMGAALLGLLQHYFLMRAENRIATFITGMISQMILLGITYIQMYNTRQLDYFTVLFFQGLAVLIYGIVIRSRSLVVTPIVFVIAGVITVAYTALQGISTIFIVGCTGIIMILLGTLAVIQRERLVRISEQFNEWNA